jgi:hypothetical protein
MVTVPDKIHTTAHKIYEWYESKKEEHRPHLGASLIGHHCDRYLWLTFRWAQTPKFDGRILRLFNTGKREEERVNAELTAIGVELHTEESPGKQIECRDESGHFGGSVDGIGRGFPEAPATWAVLECKTMNDKAFAQLKVKGVEAEKPMHYAQMQSYMGLLNIHRAAYIAVNKNTDDIYSVWLHFNPAAFQKIMLRASLIVTVGKPPLKYSNDPANWQCKMCDMHSLCHTDETAETNCRTCCHANIGKAGSWFCELHKNDLTLEKQRTGCGDHLYIPDLVPSATAIDGGENSIDYIDNVTGEKFSNGPGKLPSRSLRGRKRVIAASTPGEVRIAFDDEIPF